MMSLGGECVGSRLIYSTIQLAGITTMLHAGPMFKLSREQDVLELSFDTEKSKINVFNRDALKEFGEALSIIEAQEAVQGLYMTSAKSAFVVGADITEFLGYFSAPDQVLRAGVVRSGCQGSSVSTMPSSGCVVDRQKRRLMH